MFFLCNPLFRLPCTQTRDVFTFTTELPLDETPKIDETHKEFPPFLYPRHMRQSRDATRVQEHAYPESRG